MIQWYVEYETDYAKQIREKEAKSKIILTIVSAIIGSIAACITNFVFYLLFH